MVKHTPFKIDFMQKKVGSFNSNYMWELPLRRGYLSCDPLLVLDLAGNAGGKLGYDPKVYFTQNTCQFVDFKNNTISLQR